MIRPSNRSLRALISNFRAAILRWPPSYQYATLGLRQAARALLTDLGHPINESEYQPSEMAGVRHAREHPVARQRQ